MALTVVEPTSRPTKSCCIHSLLYSRFINTRQKERSSELLVPTKEIDAGPLAIVVRSAMGGAICRSAATITIANSKTALDKDAHQTHGLTPLGNSCVGHGNTGTPMICPVLSHKVIDMQSKLSCCSGNSFAMWDLIKCLRKLWMI